MKIIGIISDYTDNSHYTLTFDKPEEVRRIAEEYLKGQRSTNAGDVIRLVGHPAGTLEATL